MMAPTLPDSAYFLFFAGFVIVAAIGLLAGYRKWQSESALMILSSKEYKAREDALVDGIKKTIATEAAQTRELIAVKTDSLGRSIDSVREHTPTREEFADLSGKVATLQALNRVFHGVSSDPNPGTVA
jgi:hypothetical protein